MGLSAAVEAVTTVELTAAAEVTTATVAVAAMEVSAVIAAIKAASIPAMTVIAVSAAAIIPTATVAVSAAIVAVSVAVEPGAGADEDAAGEPIRPVESVGGAGVRIIVVITIGADGSRPVIHGTSYTDAKGDALGVRARSGEETNTETNAE
jgi:hypothetical protein